MKKNICKIRLIHCLPLFYIKYDIFFVMKISCLLYSWNYLVKMIIPLSWSVFSPICHAEFTYQFLTLVQFFQQKDIRGVRMTSLRGKPIKDMWETMVDFSSLIVNSETKIMLLNDRIHAAERDDDYGSKNLGQLQWGSLHCCCPQWPIQWQTTSQGQWKTLLPKASSRGHRLFFLGFSLYLLIINQICLSSNKGWWMMRIFPVSCLEDMSGLVTPIGFGL